METIRTNGFNLVRVRKCQSCGDVLMATENINGKQYEIYLGYCGYTSFYAIKKIKKF